MKKIIIEKVGVYNLSRPNELATFFWITDDGVLPDRNADGFIRNCDTFYQMNYSHKAYKNYNEAYIALINSFKRKKLL